MPGRGRSRALGRLAARVERAFDPDDPIGAISRVPSAVWWVGSILGAFYIMGRWPQIGAHIGTGAALLLRGISNGLLQLVGVASGAVTAAAGSAAHGVTSVAVAAADAVGVDDALSMATGGAVLTIEEIQRAEFRTREDVATPRGMATARNQAVMLGDWGSYWAILRGDVDRAVAVLTRTGQFTPDG